jgi:hypothetical protein
LVTALHRAIDEVLTDRQRQMFVVIVLNGVGLAALVAKLGSNRDAICKMLFDVRRKLRAALVTNGYLDTENERPTRATGARLRASCVPILATRDANEPWKMLNVHRATCDPCSEDFAGPLAAVVGSAV